MTKKKLLLLFLLGACGSPGGQTSDVASDKGRIPAPTFPGMIPLDHIRKPAADLIYKGKSISPERADALHKDGVDLSTLDPDATTDLWTDQPIKDSPTISVGSGDRLTFRNSIPSKLGKFRFNAEKSVSGRKQLFTIHIAKDAHNLILRREILTRLGYRVPKIVRLKNVEVSFSSSFQRELFVKDMGTAGDSARWVISERRSTVKLQDVLAYDAQSDIVNLAVGVPPSRIQDRRILRALVIPFTIVNMGENANMFSWRAGRVFNKHVSLDFGNPGGYQADIHDARWIARKIFELTRRDIEKIVELAEYPGPVAKLVVEKIIARRNHVAELLDLQVQEISYDTEVSDFPQLARGKILLENWTGYGSRFAYGDPESPFSGPELTAFFGTKLLSNALTGLASVVNKDILSTDIQSKVMEKKLDKITENFENYLRTGEVKEERIGLIAVPFVNGSLILSRDIVTGSYLGTDHPVQLADTVGFGVNAGVYARIDGLPSPVVVSGAVQAQYQRRFTHLKPIVSSKVGIKYPFGNMIVPMFTNKLGRLLGDIRASKLHELPAGERKERLSEVIGELKKQIEIGDSIIITDSIGVGLNVSVGYKFYGSLSAEAGISANKANIARIHIHRKDNHTFQIYDGRGDVVSISVFAALKAYEAPIIRVEFKRRKGKSITRVYNLNLDSDERRNPDVLDHAFALRSVLMSNSLANVRKVSKPFVIKHRFDESIASGRFLFLKWARFNGKTEIEVENQRGAKKLFYRTSIAKRDGKDYQELTFDVVNSLIGEVSSTPIRLSSNGSGDPGDTVGGSSVLNEAAFEAEMPGRSFKQIPDNYIVKLNQRHKGWSLNRQQARELTRNINYQYDFEFFPDDVLANTDHLRLYRLDVRMLIYPAAVEAMTTLSKGHILDLFNVKIHYTRQQDCKKKCRLAQKFFKAYDRYHDAVKENDVAKFAKSINRMLASADELLRAEDFYELIGGRDNLYASATLGGFREGDELGDKIFQSSSIGEFGSAQFLGPIDDIIRRMNVTKGEFHALWLRGKF